MLLMTHGLLLCATLILISFVPANGNLTYQLDRCEKCPGCSGYDCRYPKDILQIPYEAGCMCDDQCEKYDDCCRNSTHYKLNARRPQSSEFRCVNVSAVQMDLDENENASVDFVFIYRKDNCPSNYQDEKTRSNCENPPDSLGQHPLLITPVTVHDTKTTYRNIFCLICNENVTDEAALSYNLTYWPVRPVNCKNSSNGLELNDTMISKCIADDDFNVSYNKTVHTHCLNETFECDMVSYMPKELELANLIRHCVITTSTCPPWWKDKHITDMCASYTSIVYDDRTLNQTSEPTYYRNKYCGICHGVPEDSLNCSFSRHYGSIQKKNSFDDIAKFTVSMQGMIKFDHCNGKGTIAELSTVSMQGMIKFEHINDKNRPITDVFSNTCRNTLSDVISGNLTSYKRRVPPTLKRSDGTGNKDVPLPIPLSDVINDQV